jgi:hypothetical protein
MTLQNWNICVQPSSGRKIVGRSDSLPIRWKYCTAIADQAEIAGKYSSSYIDTRAGEVLISAESNAGTDRRGPGYGSGGVGGYIHDELGIKGHADPFRQQDGGHDAACF